MLGKTGSGLESVKNSVKNFEDKVNGTKDSVTGFYMELGATAARMATRLPSAITATIQAFGQQEAALQKLSAAVRANGGRVSEVLPIMRQFASDIQSITTYGDEQVHSMMAMATSMGVTAGQMDGVMRSACDNGHESGCCGSSGQDHDVSRIHTGTRKCKTEEEKLAQVRSFPRPDSSRRRRPRMGSTAN